MKYEMSLPEEPKVGSVVRDKLGEKWKRVDTFTWINVDNYLRDKSTWSDVMKSYGPLVDYQEPIAKGIVQFADGGGEFNPSVRYEKDGVYRYVEYNPFHKWWQSGNAEELQADQRTWYT